MKRILASALSICLLAIIAQAQSNRKPQPKAAPKSNPAVLPLVSPIEVRLGLHRQREPALFFTLKNESRNLSIKKMSALILFIDSVKLKIVRQEIQEFVFASSIGPGEISESVATREEGFLIDMSDLVVSGCRKYERSKEDSAYFVPSNCIQSGDALAVKIRRIVYVDGSEWNAPLSRAGSQQKPD